MRNTGPQRIFQGILIGVVTTLVATGVTRFVFRESAPALNASVRFGPVRYPPPIVEELRSLDQGVAADLTKLRNRLEVSRRKVHEGILGAIPQAGDGENIELLFELADELPLVREAFEDLEWFEHDRLDPAKLPWVSDAFVSDAPWLSGYWQIIVANDGEVIARSVSIDVPHARYVLIASTGNSQTHLVVRERIELGDILPKQKLTVTAWTFSEPSEFQLSQLVLRHEEGIGEVSPEKSQPNFWGSPLAIAVSSVVAMTCIVLLIAWLMGIMAVERKPAPSGKSPKPGNARNQGSAIAAPRAENVRGEKKIE